MKTNAMKQRSPKKDAFSLNRVGQRGATLLVSLIILVLLTLVGLASMDVTTVDIKVTANAKDRQLAFNRADEALFDGGASIFTVDGCVTNEDVPIFIGNQFSASDAENNTWWRQSANWGEALASVDDSAVLIESPKVTTDVPASNKISNLNLQSTGEVRAAAYYPTTARAHGPGGAPVTLESYFMKLVYESTNCDV